MYSEVHGKSWRTSCNYRGYGQNKGDRNRAEFGNRGGLQRYLIAFPKSSALNGTD